MQTKTLARIAAVAFVGVAMALAALQTQRVPTAPSVTLTLPLDDKDTHDLRAELQRCQTIGAAGADDPRCLSAWAAQRSRFLMSKGEIQTQQLAPEDDMSPLGNDSGIAPGSANASTILAVPAQDGNR